MSDTIHPAYALFAELAAAQGVAAAFGLVCGRYPELDFATRLDMAATYSLPRARELGAESGRAAGAVVIDRRTSREVAARCVLLHSQDPDIWGEEFGGGDPLSGQWTGERTPRSLVGELGLPRDGSGGDDDNSQEDTGEAERAVCDAYEEAWHDGYNAEIMRAATARLDDTRP